MSEREQIDRATLAKREFEGAKLGDARLASRLIRIAEALAKRPTESLPVAMGDEAALEASYRFLGNERVSPAAILRPHITQTHRRCEERRRVLAVFDTTEGRFGGERTGLGYLSNEKKGRGLFAHVGLAVSADGRRDPLGVLHLETIVRQAEKKARQRGTGDDNERLRWNRGVAAVHKALPQAICVMDREADVFELVSEMADRNQDFVIRAAQNRNTDDGLLWELLDDMELVSTRTVKLAERRERERAQDRKKFPPRSAHTATLEIRARAVMLCSPNSTRSSTAQKNSTRLPLYVVQVIERDPPEGEEPLQWVLLTSLPIATPEQVGFVVDAYCARWVIEEFFKALKSGCAFEKRQLESVATVTNALAVSLPIAWLLLRLRNLSRDEPEQLATGALSPLMLRCLRALYVQRTRRRLPDELTNKQLVWAIAALGGHIKNNGEPGLLVLGRGLAGLLHAADVAVALKLEPEM